MLYFNKAARDSGTCAGIFTNTFYCKALFLDKEETSEDKEVRNSRVTQNVVTLRVNNWKIFTKFFFRVTKSTSSNTKFHFELLKLLFYMKQLIVDRLTKARFDIFLTSPVGYSAQNSFTFLEL